jgi:hypothetical protein
MLSLFALLAAASAPSPAYATGEIEDEPRKPRPESDESLSRRLSMAEATSIIQAELVASPRATVGEVRAYVQERARQLVGRRIAVTIDPPQHTRPPLDIVPAKTRRRRERQAARAAAAKQV